MNILVTEQDRKDIKVLVDMVLGDYLGVVARSIQTEAAGEQPADTEQRVEDLKSMIRICYKLGRAIGISPTDADVDKLAVELNMTEL